MGTPTRHNAVLATKLTLMAADILAMSAAFFLSYEIRNRFFYWRADPMAPNIRHVYLLIGLVVLLIGYFRHVGLYQRAAFSRTPEHLSRLARSWLLFSLFFITLAFFFQIRLFIHFRITVLVLILLGWVLLYLGRFVLAPFVVNHLYRRWDWTNRILAVGGRRSALQVSEHIGLHRDSRDMLVGRIGEPEPEEEGQVCPYFGPVTELTRVVRAENIDEVFIHLDQPDWRVIGHVLEEVREAGVLVRVAMPHFGILREKMSGMPEIEQGYVYLQRSYFMSFEQRLRVLMDKAGGVAALVLLAPVIALAAVWIKLDSPGPVFFRQRRIGLDGRPFEVWKFRSMRRNTEAQHRDSIRRLVDGVSAGPDSTPLRKWTDENQVTRSGRFLRRTSLDELPQLFNVLRGEMSLVGPRPLPTYEVELLEPWQQLRHAVRPGITGFWQAYGRSSVTHRDMVLMDIFYVVSWSLALDLRILLRTVFVVLTGRGAR